MCPSYHYLIMIPTPIILTLSLLCVFKLANGQDLRNHIVADLKGIYHIYWDVIGENFTCEVQVATKGYVGFGFSPQGKMPGADIVIGWVYPNKTAVLTDRHATAFAEPPIDDHEDYHLLKGYENETHTVLRFTRKLNTCDKDDYLISDDTTKIIFSWHPEDPPQKTGLPYHGPDRRGTIRVYPLSAPPPMPEITEDVTIWNVQMPNVNLTGKLTTYWCITVKLPELTEPHEYIGFRMNITPGNEMIVHHLLFFECAGNTTKFEEEVANKAGYECILQGTVVPPPECQPPIIGWAIGSKGYTLPKNVGVPVGENHGATNYYSLQMHYNNAQQKAGIIDNTIMEVFLTKKIRPIKGSNLQIYSNIDYSLVIPPKQPAFRVTSYCPPECTAKAIPKEGITLYGAALHAHLAGRKISIRHFRGNQELKPVVVDNQFDFNYQELRQLATPIIVLPGDTLMSTCEYDSMDRNKTILGGYSTEDEMCFVYMFYYPAVPLSICIGGPPYKDILAYFGVEGVGPDMYHITGPPNLAGQSMFTYMENYDWNNVSEAKLREMYSMQYEGNMDFNCVSGRATKGEIQPAQIRYPANATMYVTEDKSCDKTTTTVPPNY